VPNVTLNIANKIIGSNRLKIKDNFNTITRTYFGSTSEVLDFSQPDTANIINKWCFDTTNGKIDKIIENSMFQNIILHFICIFY
jgi:serine protease inhibitor